MGLSDRNYMWDRDIYKDFYDTKSSKIPSPRKKSLNSLINSIKNFLDKIHRFFFKDKINQEPAEFDLKALNENLRRVREKKSAKQNINILETVEALPKIDEEIPKIIRETPEIIRETEWKPDPLITYGTKQNSDTRPLKLSNPLLLGVKMFLAEIPYIIKGNYDIDRNNCLKFSKDVQNDASTRGIRCGVVTLGFQKCPTGHAIVAFETDFGLKFFEPQTANEEYVIIGSRYTSTLAGVSNDDLIARAEIQWNDGTYTIVDTGIEGLG